MPKTYTYKEKEYTLLELEALPDCKVPSYVFRRNLWRKKLSVEDALVTPIKVMRNKSRRKYFYMGIYMTVSELSELSECKISYYHLLERLRRGATIPEALALHYEPKIEKTISKSRSISKSRQGNLIPMGGTISFRPSLPQYNKTYSYEYIVCEKLGFVMRDGEVDLEATFRVQTTL